MIGYLGAHTNESEHTSPLGVVSQLVIVLWVSGSKPHWFSKLDVLGAHLSTVCLKSWKEKYEFIAP